MDPASSIGWRASPTWKSIAVSPFVLAVALALLTTGYVDPLFTKPPDMLGIPFGLVLDALALAWAALGAFVVWTTRSAAMAALAVTTTTVPAICVLVFSPALILIMQNLAV